MIKINEKAPNFEAEAFISGEIKKINLAEFKDKWIVLFFYPGDFTFVCPTELKELSENYEKLKELGAEILSISTDSVYVHRAWHNFDKNIKLVNFPMVSDSNAKISKDYGTYIEEKGVSTRATFIIDNEGLIKAFEFHDNNIGRNINEIIRKIQAGKVVKNNKTQACPVNWEPGEEILKIR